MPRSGRPAFCGKFRHCAIAVCALMCFSTASQKKIVQIEPQELTQSIVANDLKIDTKAYLDQAWSAKGRAGLTANSGLEWDPSARQWALKSKLSDEAQAGIAQVASFTEPAGRFGVNLAQIYHELDLVDELAKFYSSFLKTHFRTLGELRKVGGPEIKQKLLGPEIGGDSLRTLAWYWKPGDGSVVLRDCYLCNAYYFESAARLIRVIAGLKATERTQAMTQFVAEYVPLLVKEHMLRLNPVDRMRKDMDPNGPQYKRLSMRDDETEDIGAAAEVLGARAYDPKLVTIDDSDLAKLKELVKVGVEQFQFSRTLTRDAESRMCASYFNGDWDGIDDMQFSGYQGEKFPTAADKSQAKGASWDFSHFSAVPIFLRSLYDNRQATGVDFPQKADIQYVGNQYAFHVFEGDYKKPLFKNFFDGSDGWFRVSYLGRGNYGIAPSHFCNMSDSSHGCTTIGGIYSWGVLASLSPDIAAVQTSLVNLARSDDPAIACFQPQCFRERFYRYGDTSFSFVDSQRKIQYPPALVIILSEYLLPLPH